MEPVFAITAFYKFSPLTEAEVPAVQSDLLAKGQELNIKGLIIVATEGVNGTVAGSAESISAFQKILEEKFGEITFKNSKAYEQPFKRYFVKVRQEIVTIGDPSVLPQENDTTHLSPTEFNRVLQEEDVVVIDARNTYETEIGMFKGAVDPRTQTFQEFPAFVKNSGIPKDKKVLMYCTGGIRCEKALVEMKKQGYENVYQLNGGILKYIEEFPQQNFEGECFVFDHRVAVNQELMPSERYKLCPHCGDPGDQAIVCRYCKQKGMICADCSQKEECRTCSRNCAHHVQKQMTTPLK